MCETPPPLFLLLNILFDSEMHLIMKKTGHLFVKHFHITHHFKEALQKMHNSHILHFR